MKNTSASSEKEQLDFEEAYMLPNCSGLVNENNPCLNRYCSRLPKYKSNDIENCPDSLTIFSIRFSNLPGFNRPLLPVDIETFTPA